MQTLDLSDANMSNSSKYVVEWLCENYQVEKYVESSILINDLQTVHSQVKNVRESVTSLGKYTCRFQTNCLGSKSLLFRYKACEAGLETITLRLTQLQICNQLLANKKLKELYLSGNAINKKTGEILCQSLERNSTLTTLALRNCSLGKSTLISLLKVLKKSKESGLKVIDLALNPDVATVQLIYHLCLTSQTDVVETIEEMLTINRALEDLNLSACKLNGKYLSPIVAGVARNTGLKA
jgi:hypothetical protein